MGQRMADMHMQENVTEWTANQHKFMVWLALPSEQRMPFTEEGLAKEMGINPITFWRWKQLPGFKTEVQRLITDSLGDNYHDVMDALKKKAAKGSFPHQKMYLEMLGLYVQRSEVKGSFNVDYAGYDSTAIDREIVAIVTAATKGALAGPPERARLPVGTEGEE